MFISPIQMTSMIYPAIFVRAREILVITSRYIFPHKIYACLWYTTVVYMYYGYQHINIYVMGIDLLSIFYKSYFYLICSANSNVRYILNCISSFFPHQRVKREELLCVKKSLSHFLSYCNFVYVGNTHASWCQTTRRKNLNLPYITFYFNIYPIISATKFM